MLPDAFLADDELTAQKCADYCTGKNLPYFGLEYGRECWCGVSPPLESGEVDPEECSQPCSGSGSGSAGSGGSGSEASQEICGAADRLTVYGRVETPLPAVGEYEYLGCYTDSPVTGQHSLTGKITYDAQMTLDKCRATCEKDGYPYFGTEYGSQCFCGTTLYSSEIIDEGDNSDSEDDVVLSGPRAFKVSNRQCSMRCGGDSTGSTTCGDANRLSVYWNGEVSEARNLGFDAFEALTPPLQGWRFAACVRDDTAQRTLTGPSMTSPDMTVEMCVQFCTAPERRYNFAGLEYQTECYCGTQSDIMASFGLRVDASECEELCGGDEDEFCGGPRRLSLYGQIF